MRRLLYRVMVLNLTIFLFATLGLLLSRQLIDPENTPYQTIRESLGIALELEDPPEEIQARLDRLHERLGGRITVYTEAGELVATSVTPGRISVFASTNSMLAPQKRPLWSNA